MKEYKLVYLNKGLKFSMEKDLEQAETIITQYVAVGGTLPQITARGEVGVMIGVFYKESKL